MGSNELKQIDTALKAIEQQLISSPLNVIEVLVLQGRCRELRAARWLISRVIYPSKDLKNPKKISTPTKSKSKSSAISSQNYLSYESLYESLYESIVECLGMSLENQTSTPLEIDVLKEDKKRELLFMILQEFGLLLEELQNSQFNAKKSEQNLEKLLEKIPLILSDLWRSATTKFWGRYYTLKYEGKEIELVNELLKDRPIIEVAILSKIPFVFDLFSFLLFETDLVINNTTYEAQTPQAIARAKSILSNLLIQVANAVMQPLLNHFADVEEIKQKFYSYDLVTTREVERFRNNLSWHYRLENSWGEPQAIYESQFYLFTFTTSGIKKLNVYASRRHELVKLSGIPFLVTLWLELQDAIAPRLRAITAFIGAGLVYVLKNILGRGIGLIGKGILQGIGDSLNWGKVRRRSDRL